MADPLPQRRAPGSAVNQRLLWIVVIACWIIFGLWVWINVRPHFTRRAPALRPEVTGRFLRVETVLAPLGLRLEGGTEVRLAGIAAPDDAGAAARAAARLAELAPPGAIVFVEMEPPPPGDSIRPPASVWLPPPALGGPPFPYDKSRLLGAVLVQEGLVPVADEPYLYRNELRMLEDDARRHECGLWAAP